MTTSDAVGCLAKDIALNLNLNISIILAGYKGTLEPDDLHAGSLIYYKQLRSLQVQGEHVPVCSDNLLEPLLTSPAGIRLSKLNLEKDIYFCAQEDITQIVPIYDEKIQQLIPFVYAADSGESLLC